jgi:hypothetical protein
MSERLALFVLIGAAGAHAALHLLLPDRDAPVFVLGLAVAFGVLTAMKTKRRPR